MEDLIIEYHDLINDIFYKCETAANNCTDMYNRGFDTMAKEYATEHNTLLSVIKDNGLESRYANYLKPTKVERKEVK